MRKIAVNVFGLLLLLSLDPEVMSDSKCKIQTNGCSVPLDFSFPYRGKFKPACVKHDVCYYCVRSDEKYSITFFKIS